MLNFLNCFSLLILSFIFGCNSSENKHESINLGAILSLSGPAGEQGQNIRKGIELYVHEHQENTVKFFYEDDATQPAKAVNSFQKLVSVNKVSGVIGGTWDYLGEAIFPFATKQKIFTVTATSPEEILSPEAFNSSFVYTNSPGLKKEKDAIRKLLLLIKPSSLISIYPNLPFGTSKAEIFKELSAELQIPIKAEYAFAAESARADAMRQAALKAQEVKADFGLVITDYDGLDVFTKELQRLDVTLPFVTSQHLDKAISFSKEPLRFKNIYALYPQIKDPTFLERFKAFHHEEPGVFAAQGYDSAHFLVQTKAANGKPFVFEGVTGTCVSERKTVCDGDIEVMVSRGDEMLEIFDFRK